MPENGNAQPMHNVCTKHTQRESFWKSVKKTDYLGNPHDRAMSHVLKRIVCMT